MVDRTAAASEAIPGLLLTADLAAEASAASARSRMMASALPVLRSMADSPDTRLRSSETPRHRALPVPSAISSPVPSRSPPAHFPTRRKASGTRASATPIAAPASRIIGVITGRSAGPSDECLVMTVNTPVTTLGDGVAGSPLISGRIPASQTVRQCGTVGIAGIKKEIPRPARIMSLKPLTRITALRTPIPITDYRDTPCTPPIKIKHYRGPGGTPGRPRTHPARRFRPAPTRLRFQTWIQTAGAR